MKKFFGFVVMLILFGSFTLDVSAIEKEFSYSYRIGSESEVLVTTSDGYWLIEDCISYVEENHVLKNCDIVRINKEGIAKKISLVGKETKLINYEGKAYVLFMNVNKERLEVYNEKLELIDTEELYMSNGEYIGVYQDDSYIRIYEGIVAKPRSIIYDLKTQQTLSSIKRPTQTFRSYFYSENLNELVFYDKLGQINRLINIRDYTDEIVYLNGTSLGYKYNDQYTIFIEDSSQERKWVATFTEEEGLINLQELDDTFSFFGGFQLDSKLIFFDYTGNYERIMYEFDLETLKLTKVKVESNVNASADQINNQLYLDTYRETNKLIPKVLKYVVKDKDHQEVYRLDDGLKHMEFDKYLLKYITDKESLSSIGLEVIEASTGRYVATLPVMGEFYFIGDSVYNKRYESSAEGDSVHIIGDLYRLPIDSSTDELTYDKSKAWTITFSQLIDKDSITNQNVYVVNTKGEHISTEVEVMGKQLIVHAPVNGYQANETYTLYVKEGIRSLSGEAFSNQSQKSFKVH